MASFNPRDLSINLKAVTKGQHVLNGGPKGAIFPGWFLTVQENEGYNLVAGPVQLNVDDVLAIADVIDLRIHKDNLGRRPVVTAVGNCDNAMRDELRRQLDVAESQAAKIPDLKRRLGISG